MKDTEAIYVLARFATANISGQPPENKFAIYSALAALLPDDHDRAHASRVATAIRESEQLQLTFVSKLGYADSKPLPKTQPSR